MRKGHIIQYLGPTLSRGYYITVFSFNYSAKYILDKYQIKGLVFDLGNIKEEEQDMAVVLSISYSLGLDMIFKV